MAGVTKHAIVMLYAACVLMLPIHASAQVQITGLADFSFGTWSGTGDLQSSDPVAVCRNGSTEYVITASGSGAGGAFTLANGGNSLAYEVAFRGSSGGFQSLTANSTSPTFTAAHTSLDDCPGASNADVRVTIPSANLLGALAGSYSGTLTITLSAP